MEPVNTTDTKKWSSIDIYLFSNGQQYSPPRKYHLRSEELQWWGTTVSYLGRTHYGSGHSSIDIYTTDGIKINCPLELINGAAYVAVEPPDTFVDTGYEEYLLRASRSWDKRLVQKSANNPETTDLKSNVSADNTITSVENTSAKVGDDTTSSLKSQATKFRPLPQKKPIINAKQIQKKKSSEPHNTTLKRICAETEKIFPCPGKSSLKNEVPNRKRLSLNPCKRNVSQDQSTCSKNLNAIKREKSLNSEYNGAHSDNKTSNRIEGLQYPLLSCNDSLDLKPMIRKNRILTDTTLGEVQTVVSLYQNRDQDLTSITYNPDSDRIVEKSAHQQNSIKNYDLKDLDDENSAPVQQDAFLQPTKLMAKEGVNNPTVDEIKTAIKNVNEQNVFPVNNDNKDNKSIVSPNEKARENNLETENTISNSHMSDKMATDEYIAHMNRGGLLLLKFKIKVKNCKTIFNRDKSNNTQLTSSLINLLKTEKMSQVDIDVNFSSELLKANNGRCSQDKSLQSVLNNLYTENTDHIDRKHPRIIIIKCACPEYSRYDKDGGSTICGCSDEEEIYKVMPKQKLNGTYPRCHCYNETYRNSKDNPLVYTPDAYSTKDYRPSTIKTNGPRVSYLAQKFENADKILSNNDRLFRNEGHRQSVGTPKSLETTVEHPISEDVSTIAKSVCDKSIQTDWSNVILEARRHEDENYTFHLPSLYLLKQCKL